MKLFTSPLTQTKNVLTMFIISLLIFRNIILTMKASPSPSVTCGKKKRKNEAPAADEGIKRFKTEEGDLQERPRHSARLSVCLDRLQQPITLAELMELLHFAALGKAAGIKQPRYRFSAKAKRVCARLMHTYIVFFCPPSHQLVSCPPSKECQRYKCCRCGGSDTESFLQALPLNGAP